MKNYICAVVLTGLTFCSMSRASHDSFPAEIRIIAPKSSICVGEPLILQITYIYKEPQASSRDPNKMITARSPDAMVRVSHGDTETIMRDPPLLLGDLRLQGSAGLEYSGNFLLFYDHNRKALVFPTPGKYEVTVLRVSKLPSNTIQVTITKATPETSLALSLIKDFRPFISMEAGSDSVGNFAEHPEWVPQLKSLAEKAGNTVLGKWAAASLGLASYDAVLEQGRQRNQRGEPFYTQSPSPTETGQLQDAKRYLDEALNLDDQFPLREGAVYWLAEAESTSGNAERAAALRKELVTKYPYGQYGSLAHVKTAVAQMTPSPVSPPRRLLSWPIVVVCVAAIVVLVLLGAKRFVKPKGPSVSNSRSVK